MKHFAGATVVSNEIDIEINQQEREMDHGQWE